MPGGITGARARVFIGPVHDDQIETLEDWDDLVSGDWKEIEEVTGIGEFVLTFAEVTSETFGNEVVEKYKGTANPGSLQLVVNYVPSEPPGQLALKAAVASYDAYSIKIELNNKPAGASSKPTRAYFAARVMTGGGLNISGPNAMVGTTHTLGICTKPIIGKPVTGA